MTRFNAMFNCKNPYQGGDKRVLCVCSAGLLRSPTVARILEGMGGFNTRACGVHDYALIEINEVLLTWAEWIIFAEQGHFDSLPPHLQDIALTKKVSILDIPDNFGYMDEVLVNIIKDKLWEALD